MKELPVSVGFPFQREFIPRGCKLPRTEWFKTEDSALIRVIEPLEATPAFHIRFPERTLPDTVKARRLPAIALELLRYDGNIWWPLFIWETDRAPLVEHSVDFLFKLLREEHDLFGFVPREGAIAHESGMFDFARKLCRDEREDNLTVVARKVRDNFLICGERAYVRGGLPIYVRGWLDASRREFFSVTSNGADRSIRPAVDLSFTYRAQEWQPAFQSEDFWLADDRAAALAASGKSDGEAPTIEILLPELVAQIRFEVMLDAIFVGALRMFDQPARAWKPVRFGVKREDA